MSLKNFVGRAALACGLNVKASAGMGDVRSMLRRLHPVKTDAPLIRLGNDRDGGYLVPDDLEGITACFSPGVDVKASFEEDCLRRGIPCFLADASVDGPPGGIAGLDFEKKFVGSWNDDLYVTMDRWIAEKAGDRPGDRILQMDIEGAEWQALLEISEENLKSFRILVIEFHRLPHCFDLVALNLFNAVLGRLSEHFHVVHAHPNNTREFFKFRDLEIPHYLEVTYLRKDRAMVLGPACDFPHPLDAACAPTRPDPPLPKVLRAC